MFKESIAERIFTAPHDETLFPRKTQEDIHIFEELEIPDSILIT